jgi:hypothetical protein
VARNITVRGQVLVLDVPKESDGKAFMVAFLPSGGSWSSQTLIARAGEHAYDLRRLPKWKGAMVQVVVSLSGVRGELREPTLRDEWDMFMTPEPLLPATAHMLTGHTVFGYSWDLALFLVFALTALGLRWGVLNRGQGSEVRSQKTEKGVPALQPLPLGPRALLLGFLAAWVVMDVRIWADHFNIAVRTERQGGNLFLLPEVKKFCERAAGLIGNRTWTRDSNLAGGGLFDGFIDYHLAEHPYQPPGVSPPADFRIVARPDPKNAIWRSGGFSLLQTRLPKQAAVPKASSGADAPRLAFPEQESASPRDKLSLLSLLVIAAHLAVNLWTGWVLLCLWPGNRTQGETLTCALLVGIYLETLGVASLLFLQCPLTSARWLALVLPGVLTVVGWWQGCLPVPHWAPGSLQVVSRLRWYEWALLVTVGEKVAFAVWQLTRTPVYFVDALTHWSGRGRALYTGVNWSMEPISPAFLGFDAAKHYPLLTPIWRALTASFNGGWDDLLARADGIAFYLVTLASVWFAIRRWCGERWLAAAATFIVSAMPLHAWHTAAGYSDIAVEAFAVSSLAAVLRREYVLAGVLAAGTAWSKNDGLAIWLPVLLLASLLPPTTTRDSSHHNRGRAWSRAGRFLCGFASLAPWLVFKWWHQLGLSPTDDHLSWHPDSVKYFTSYVLLGPTSSIFWGLCLAALAWTALSLVRDGTGRILLSAVLTYFLILAFVFTCTDSFQWLANQATVHRSMMQLSPVAVLTVTYGLCLKGSRQ